MNDFEKGYNEGYKKGRQDSVDNICKAIDDYGREFEETKGRCILDRKLPFYK